MRSSGMPRHASRTEWRVAPSAPSCERKPYASRPQGIDDASPRSRVLPSGTPTCCEADHVSRADCFTPGLSLSRCRGHAVRPRESPHARPRFASACEYRHAARAPHRSPELQRRVPTRVDVPAAARSGGRAYELHAVATCALRGTRWRRAQATRDGATLTGLTAAARARPFSSIAGACSRARM